MVALRFPEDSHTVFGACESAIGLGMMIGPILGQIFYYFEFEGSFYGYWSFDIDMRFHFSLFHARISEHKRK
jgi:hypothetical protein